jgi:membrane associated rhomboid family serine protease
MISGTIPYLIVYFAGGIYGFVLGGNFGRVGVPSAGASGALFAIVSLIFPSPWGTINDLAHPEPS